MYIAAEIIYFSRYIHTHISFRFAHTLYVYFMLLPIEFVHFAFSTANLHNHLRLLLCVSVNCSRLHYAATFSCVHCCIFLSATLLHFRFPPQHCQHQADPPLLLSHGNCLVNTVTTVAPTTEHQRHKQYQQLVRPHSRCKSSCYANSSNDF